MCTTLKHFPSLSSSSFFHFIIIFIRIQFRNTIYCFGICTLMTMNALGVQSLNPPHTNNCSVFLCCFYENLDKHSIKIEFMCWFDVMHLCTESESELILDYIVFTDRFIAMSKFIGFHYFFYGNANTCTHNMNCIRFTIAEIWIEMDFLVFHSFYAIFSAIESFHGSLNNSWLLGKL